MMTAPDSLCATLEDLKMKVIEVIMSLSNVCVGKMRTRQLNPKPLISKVTLSL